jgi:Asp-tRNA(Asn)/Glu-tRNA(Gln) amidotransferase A subunit family amidase
LYAECKGADLDALQELGLLQWFDARSSTTAPIGLTGAGLPVGLQIIGPEGEDSTTIEFARLLAAEIGGFVPPPAHS